MVSWHGGERPLASGGMVSVGCAGQELFGAVGAAVLKGPRKMLGLDVTAHVGDGLVLEETADGADAVGSVPQHKLVQILPDENGAVLGARA